MVKRLSAMRETPIRFLGWEDPLEKEMAIHSSTLAWKILWTEEPDRLQSMGSQRVGHYSGNLAHTHNLKTNKYLLYCDFPGGSDGKASVYDVGDPGSIPGLGRSLGEGNGNPL